MLFTKYSAWKPAFCHHSPPSQTKVYKNKLRGCWAEAERDIVDSRYASYVIPYADFTRQCKNINIIHPLKIKITYKTNMKVLSFFFFDSWLTLPFPCLLNRDDTFTHEVNVSVEDMVMLTATWSGFNNFCQKNGEAAGEKLLDKYRNKLMDILNVPTSPEETVFTKRTPFFLLMARKP